MAPKQTDFCLYMHLFSDQVYCRVWGIKAPLWSFAFSSSYNLVAVNLERYLSIIAPIYHKTKVIHALVHEKMILNHTYEASGLVLCSTQFDVL